MLYIVTSFRVFSDVEQPQGIPFVFPFLGISSGFNVVYFVCFECFPDFLCDDFIWSLSEFHVLVNSEHVFSRPLLGSNWFIFVTLDGSFAKRCVQATLGFNYNKTSVLGPPYLVELIVSVFRRIF